MIEIPILKELVSYNAETGIHTNMDTCGKLVLLGSEEITMTLRAPVVHAEEPDEELESPFLNDNPAPLDGQLQMTPEQALIDSVAG